MKIFPVTRISKNKSIFIFGTIYNQGLIQKKSKHRLWESAQVSNLANKIATQWWPNIIIKDSKLSITFIFYFLVIMFTLCPWFDQKPGIAFNGGLSFT